MSLWQPENSLDSDQCDDLRIAHRAKLMHTIKNLGELSAAWEQSEGTQFHAACPRATSRVIELVAGLSQEVIVTPVDEFRAAS